MISIFYAFLSFDTPSAFHIIVLDMSGQQGFLANFDAQTAKYKPFLNAPVKDCRIVPTLAKMVLKRKVTLLDAKPSTDVVVM